MSTRVHPDAGSELGGITAAARFGTDTSHKEKRETGAEPLSKLRRGLTQLLDNSDDPGYEEAAFHWAAWAHVQVVSIQPFEDGNKRTARLLMSHILTTLGFDALTFEHCRREYMDALKEALDSGDVGLLRDLAIRTYVESL